MKEFLNNITKHIAWLWLATAVLLVFLLVWNIQLQNNLSQTQVQYRNLNVQSQQSIEDLENSVRLLKAQNEQTARDLKTAMPPGFIFPNTEAILHIDKALADVMQIEFDGIDKRPEMSNTPAEGNNAGDAKSKSTANKNKNAKDSKDTPPVTALGKWWQASKPIYKDKLAKLGEEILGSWIRVQPIASIDIAQQTTENLLASRAQIAMYLQTAKLALQADQNASAEQNLLNAKALAQKILTPRIDKHAEVLREIDATLALLKPKG